MISKQEKSQIKGTIQSPQWLAVSNFAEEVILKIRDNSPIRETTDETLRELYLREGKIMGIREFFQSLIELTNEKDE